MDSRIDVYIIQNDQIESVRTHIKMSKNHNQKTLSILRVIAQREEPSLSSIIADTKLPKSTIMRHLSMLREDYCLVLKTVRDNRRRFYQVESWGAFDPEFFRALTDEDVACTSVASISDPTRLKGNNSTNE